MHQLPSMARSFIRHHPGQPGDDALLEGSQASDGGAELDKPAPRSASVAALTSVRVVVGAGVEASSRSEPNLHSPSFSPRKQGGSGGAGLFGEGPAAPPQPSRLARLPHIDPSAAAGLVPPGSPPARQQPGGGAAEAQQGPLRDSLASHASSLFGRPSSFSFLQVRRMLVVLSAADRQACFQGSSTFASSIKSCLHLCSPLPPQHIAPPDKQRSMASVRSKRTSTGTARTGGAGAGGARDSKAAAAAPALEQLIDLEQTPQQLRAQRARRTSIVQVGRRGGCQGPPRGTAAGRLRAGPRPQFHMCLPARTC